MNQLLSKYINEHKEEILCQLSKFVEIPSESNNPDMLKTAIDFVLELGRKLGFKAQSFCSDQVAVIEMEPTEVISRDQHESPQQIETFGILSHVDVVPPGDLEEWDTPPYEAIIKDGKIFGRGTLDDKGMIIASLYAMKAVLELARASNEPVKKKVQLILGTQEEVEWTDMDAYVAGYPLPDYGFSPDGEYPICNIEKGCVDYTLDFDVSDSCSQLHIRSIACGVAQNSVPGKATAILSDGREIIAYGKTVHSCQPERGENALFSLCEKMVSLGVAENKLMRLLEEITDKFSSIYGQELGLYSESEFYEGEFVHRNAFSPTIFNSQDGRATLNINCRFPYGESEERLLEGIREFAVQNNGTVTDVYAMPAVFVSKARPFLKVFAKSYEEITGLENEFTLAYGGSYAKAMPNIVSWGPIFPGEEDTCHEANEYIGIDSLLNSTKIFANTIAVIVLSGKSYK